MMRKSDLVYLKGKREMFQISFYLIEFRTLDFIAKNIQIVFPVHDHNFFDNDEDDDTLETRSRTLKFFKRSPPL